MHPGLGAFLGGGAIDFDVRGLCRRLHTSIVQDMVTISMRSIVINGTLNPMKDPTSQCLGRTITRPDRRSKGPTNAKETYALTSVRTTIGPVLRLRVRARLMGARTDVVVVPAATPASRVAEMVSATIMVTRSFVETVATVLETPLVTLSLIMTVFRFIELVRTNSMP